ncbi:MAG: 16S rRNA processing protein RimM [Bdellovibrionales bacterium]|nr:16S rRNA processing protein RimM [Bdellovibrionales bacterium]
MTSINADDYFKVGWIKEAHGLKGEVYVKLLSKDPEWLGDLEEFILSREGEAELYSVKKWRPHKQGLIVLIEGVTNRNQSEALKGFEFAIPKDLLVSDENEAPYLIEFMGFQVVDQTLGLIGEVVGFVDNGAQDLLEVQAASGQKHLIPFVDAFSVEVKRSEKQIEMNLPEGLIE